MKMFFESEADFSSFKKELRLRLASRQIRYINDPALKEAAVMMLLMNKDGAPHVLLTKRTETVATHKGQVALPGGGVDEDDDDSLDAAFRETEEEIGIASNKIEYLGRFDDYISIAGFRVACHVGAVEYPYPCALSRDEIESCFEAPLAIFVNAAYDKCELVKWQGNEYRVYFYHYQGYEIWGMTARILTDFGEKICRD